jgi:UDP-N-acetyl-D-galactosamine dehydrogenase
MGKFIAEQTIKKMITSGSTIKGARVNVLGLTFKENCGDLRNSKVVDIIRELETFGVEVFVSDPLADSGEALREYSIELRDWKTLPKADAIVIAVAHREYKNLITNELGVILNKNGIIIDVKSIFELIDLEQTGRNFWQL